jgi:hypothetical protein
MSEEKQEPTTVAKISAIVVVALIVLFIVTIASGGGGDKSKSMKTVAVGSNVSSSQQPKKTVKPETKDLATRVDTQLKKNLGYSSYIEAGAPFEYINGMKTESGGWVVVNYQTDCDKDTATFVATQVMQMVGRDIKDLKTVSVNCVSNGTSSYVNRDVLGE